MSASELSSRFDWSLRSSYEYAVALTPRDWAWEFLRRNPEFQMAWWQSRDTFEITFSNSTLTIIHARTDALAAENWGCFYTDAPDIDARSANVFWSPAHFATILHMHAVSTDARSNMAPFDLRQQTCPASLLFAADSTQHLLFHGRGHGIQLAVSGASLLEPVHLLADPVFNVGEARQRLEALARFNDFVAGLPPPVGRKAMRLGKILQALDGSLAGAPHRDIAVALFGTERVEADWNDPGQNLRDRVRRAVKRGRDLMSGGYLKFLR